MQVPDGRTSSSALRTIAERARKDGDGSVHVATHGGLEFRLDAVGALALADVAERFGDGTVLLTPAIAAFASGAVFA
jgi:dissimilatory sulfite reductase (desulfoviridin) alpha/beta subunit